MTTSDDLTLKVAGQILSGWTSVRVTASVEKCPPDFEISMTERFPGEFNAVSANPGDPCEVYIGADRVVTGYIDRLMPMITAGEHSITAIGRGQGCDLVDCSADWPSATAGGIVPGRFGRRISSRIWSSRGSRRPISIG
jgi:prophage tail gpP-like protein